jgi:selenocysteine-specific elongation factor
VPVVATAGHVDHGKSALILALTGMDPDRLREEKERGMTIDLGFAWLSLPSGAEVGIVDVPGHERFIRNMLAGVGSVRISLFVVAANEGFRPQSEEHLAILDLLGVQNGVVAVTKTDLVDEETLELAVLEVKEKLASTSLKGFPILPVSSTTKKGTPELVLALDKAISGAPQPKDVRRPRFWVDRVFTIKGAGTVVTGTLMDGKLKTEMEVELLPPGTGEELKARIRGLQTHKHSAQEVPPGSRVAVNLSGVDPGQLERGTLLCATAKTPPATPSTAGHNASATTRTTWTPRHTWREILAAAPTADQSGSGRRAIAFRLSAAARTTEEQEPRPARA